MSWEQLLAIRDEQRDAVIEEETRVPSACPQCGEPLLDDGHGGLRCPFDGYRWCP